MTPPPFNLFIVLAALCMVAGAEEKRAPSLGFVGMRGKKPAFYWPDDATWVKRAPSGGFLGMRGKKVPEEAKRVPSGFIGTRGKKDVDEIATYLDADKRAPSSGFFGMRGKKQPTAGFFGMRGKKYPYEFRGKFVGVRGKKDGSILDYGWPEDGADDSFDIDRLMLMLAESQDGATSQV